MFPKKILVTGGAGFIGSHLSRNLLKSGFKVICIDNFNNNYPRALKENNIKDFKENKQFLFYEENICQLNNLEKIIAITKPDKLCHIAAQVGVRESLNNPSKYIRTNITGTLNLLKLSVKYKIKNFVFASSSSVYGNSFKIPYTEKDTDLNPISPYGITKRTGELLLYYYHYHYGLNVSILRFFSVYGPGGRPDMAPFLFTDAIYHGHPIKRYGNGKTKRDFTYIEDIIFGIIKTLDKDFPFEIINLGNNHPVELNFLISLIEKYLKKRGIIKKYAYQPGEMKITYADISKAQKLLNYHPKTTINSGIKKLINWYLKTYINNITTKKHD